MSQGNFVWVWFSWCPVTQRLYSFNIEPENSDNQGVSNPGADSDDENSNNENIVINHNSGDGDDNNNSSISTENNQEMWFFVIKTISQF